MVTALLQPMITLAKTSHPKATFEENFLFSKVGSVSQFPRALEGTSIIPPGK